MDMDNLKKALVYWRKLNNNELDHGNIFSNRLVLIMSKFNLWWTDEDFKKVPKWIKVMYMLFCVRWATCMGLSLLYLGMHWDSKPILLILQDVAICVAGFFGSSAPFLFGFYRNRTSILLRAINELNLDILKRTHNSPANRRNSNRLYMGLSILCTIMQLLAVMTFLVFAWDFAKSGLPNFNSFLYQPAPYSVMGFVDEISFLCVGIWLITLCTLYLSMYIEFFLRISFHFRVTAEEMRQLRRGFDINEEKEQKKLKTLIKDLNLLYWFVDECNVTIRIYMILYFWLAFTTFGVYAVVILSIGSGSVMESMHLFVFPLYLTLFTVSFCGIGQHLKDSAGEVRVGISDCDWYSAPIPFRKLVLNVLIRCTRETIFRASPFYELDLQLLTRVIKTTYTLIAVF